MGPKRIFFIQLYWLVMPVCATCWPSCWSLRLSLWFWWRRGRLTFLISIFNFYGLRTIFSGMKRHFWSIILLWRRRPMIWRWWSHGRYAKHLRWSTTKVGELWHERTTIHMDTYQRLTAVGKIHTKWELDETMIKVETLFPIPITRV